MKNNKKVFEELKKQLINKRIEEKRRTMIPLFEWIKLQFKGKGLYITHDMKEKMKLLEQRNFDIWKIGNEK